ncbi:hypothetical protein BKA63DRAFT_157621 [Paraphoma chrysanthemicola]|nr:hypothetical protein BKA63DRAFT_157621 [Paraphoma chrysanthemicola]
MATFSRRVWVQCALRSRSGAWRRSISGAAQLASGCNVLGHAGLSGIASAAREMASRNNKNHEQPSCASPRCPQSLQSHCLLRSALLLSIRRHTLQAHSDGLLPTPKRNHTRRGTSKIQDADLMARATIPGPAQGVGSVLGHSVRASLFRKLSWVVLSRL